MTVIHPVLAGILPGGGELWVIVALALLFFGASKLPGLARSLGRSVSEFKAGMKDEPVPDPNAKPAGGGGETPQN